MATSTTHPVSLYLAVLCPLTASAVIAFVPSGPSEAVIAWTVSLVTSLILLIIASSSMLAVRGSQISGTFLLSILNIAAVVVPSVSLVWRSRTATVERLLGSAIATPESLSRSLLLFTAALVAFAIGEFVAASMRGKSGRTQQLFAHPSRLARHTASVLIAVGLATYAFNVSQGIGASFATRGEAQGQGLISMAAWALPIGIAMSVMNNHWNSRLRVAASVAGVILIILMGVRSPLILIALAFVPRAFSLLRGSRHPMVIVGATILGANALIAVGTGINLWRGGIRRGTGGSLPDAVMAAWVDPFGALSTAGLDTIDGALFVHALPPGAVSTGPSDLLKAIIYLVPRQLFPDKPELLSNELSERYLNFGTAGMFLSGPGYLELILGGVIPAIGGFLIMGLLFGGLVPRGSSSVGWLISAYVLVRFYMGGDAYDFFLGLQLTLVWAVARVIASLTTSTAPGRRQHSLRPRLTSDETPLRRTVWPMREQ